jgi:RNA polymerase sigma-70 factor (ECF subfamily)
VTEDRRLDPDGCAAGDAAPAAPAEVDYGALRDQLARSVARICPGWLLADRDDIVQAAVLRIMRMIRAGEYNPAAPESYLWKVAFSAVMNEIRRVRRRRETSMEEALPSSRHPAADPARDDERRALGAAIQRCLARLNERRRAEVALHLTGHTVDEVSGLLDWNRRKVQNLLTRGIADLRLCLRSRGLQP